MRNQQKDLAPYAPSFVWTAVAPAVFVVLWSSGFIGGKAGLLYAEPLTFLSVRFMIVTVVMLIAALLVRAAWPKAEPALSPRWPSWSLASGMC